VCRLLLLLSVTTWWHSCLAEPVQETQEDMSRELPISSVCPERERATARACKVVGFGHEGKQATEAIRARLADATLVVCLQKWREMRPYSRLFCPWLMSWRQAITRRSARTSRQVHAWWSSVMGSGLCASLAIHHLGAEPTIVLGHQSEQMALTSTGTSLRHPVL